MRWRIVSVEGVRCGVCWRRLALGDVVWLLTTHDLCRCVACRGSAPPEDEVTAARARLAEASTAKPAGVDVLATFAGARAPMQKLAPASSVESLFDFAKLAANDRD